MKIKVEVEICFAPKSWIFKWVWAEKARKALAVWLIRAGLRVSGSSEMITTPHLWKRIDEKSDLLGTRASRSYTSLLS